jgi:hypothetical protein
VIDDLKRLDSSKQYTSDEFKTAIKRIDSHFVNDLSDANWQATLDYLSVVQSEIVSYPDSPVYSRNLFDKFLEISGGKDAIIGLVTSSSQDDKDAYQFYQ